MDLTEINTFWRQIARVRTYTHTHVTDNIYTRTGTPGNLSYTAEEEARNEPNKGGNKKVVEIYWKNEAEREDMEKVRGCCEGHSGLTINGDELLVCSADMVEDLRKNDKMIILGCYDLNLFERCKRSLSAYKRK